MRGHEKYLEKVNDELDVYRKYLLKGEEIPERFQEVSEKIEIARAWIRVGYSDSEVLTLLKNDPKTRLNSRRAREVMALAYEIYADIRLKRNGDGLKQKYSDEFNDAAMDVMDEIREAKGRNASAKDLAGLYKVWNDLKSEAAKIDNAYQPTPKAGLGGKKPTKVIFKRKTVIKNDKVISDDTIEEATYELQ